MARYYSNQFNAGGGNQPAAVDYAQRGVNAGIYGTGGQQRVSIGRLTIEADTDTANDDELRMIRNVPSGAVLRDMTIEIGSAPTVGTIDIGLYQVGDDHDGAVVHVDLFEDGAVVTSGLAEASAFTGNTLTALDRGKALWELVNVDGGTYAEDPKELWDIVITTVAGIATATDVEIVMVAEFIDP